MLITIISVVWSSSLFGEVVYSAVHQPCGQASHTWHVELRISEPLVVVLYSAFFVAGLVLVCMLRHFDSLLSHLLGGAVNLHVCDVS